MQELGELGHLNKQAAVTQILRVGASHVSSPNIVDIIVIYGFKGLRPN